MTDPLPPAREVDIREQLLKEGALAHVLPIRIHNLVFEDIPALLSALDAERARAEKAESYGAPVAGAVALSHVKEPCKQHDAYWTTASGACMACRATEAEARVRKLEEALLSVRVELAALVPDPEADTQTWTLAFPDIREPDRKCLQDAYDIARTALEPRNV